MILVDTSVWIDHFHAPVARLVEALEAGDVLTHPFVVGELACGRISRRGEVLGLLAALPSAPVATSDEVLQFIEERELTGKGIGYLDVHLLASVTLSAGARLWTTDKRLRPVAATLRLSLNTR